MCSFFFFLYSNQAMYLNLKYVDLNVYDYVVYKMKHKI